MMIKQKIKSIDMLNRIVYFSKVIKSLLTRKKCVHEPEMLTYKNKYLNNACFIIATGPSLTIEDLELLKGRHSIGVNSIVKSFDKTDWRPDYLVISDPIPLSALKEHIHQKDFKRIFIAKGIGKCSEDSIRFALYNYQRAKCQMKRDFSGKLYPDNNFEKYFVNTPSSIFSAIQLAYFMGFRTLYLIGQDCSFGRGEAHSDITKIKYKVSANATDSENIIATFENFKEWANKNNLNIYNVTRGGYLEVFPRITLEEALIREG